MAPAKDIHEITDRAKRYRANARPPEGPRRCNFCASRQNIDIDHIGGDEAEVEPANLMYLCRSCNTRKSIQQKRAYIGVRTAQFNPRSWAKTFQQWKDAAATLLGLHPGDVGQATETIRNTPPAARIRYGDMIEAANPFRSEAQRRKFFAMAGRGEISKATLRKFIEGNPAAPTFEQYAHGVSIHQRGAHDEGGAIIHATPANLRSRYAKRIAEVKASRRGEVPF